jgi:precorrin-6B methylase 2
MAKENKIKKERKISKIPSTPPSKGAMDAISSVTLNIESKASLIHIGSLDSFDITEGGKNAGKLILDYIETGKLDSIKQASIIYDKIIPDENFGGEYTALRWICTLLIATGQGKGKDLLSEPMVASWYDFLSKDNFANLKEYINLKYHFVEIGKEDATARVTLRFLEDFILFNNPDRERWDKTSENLWVLRIRKGDRIIDFGSGPGYFTFKFADLVGKEGYVYAIETNKQHIRYLHDYIGKHDIRNVEVIEFDGSIDLKNSPKVDIIYMCSLYHIIYAASTDGERDLLIGSIRNCLKDDGRLVIVDNDLVEDKDLPYHGPYITRELIISQLWHYGFEMMNQYQFSAQRYILEFRMSPMPEEADTSIPTPAMIPDPKSPNVIQVTSRSSLVRFRMIGVSSQGYTLSGKKAARLFYTALEKKDRKTAETALSAYKQLIPKERFGDEYTAFQWFCQYLLSSKEQQDELIRDKFVHEFFQYMASDDYAFLKKYLRIKYDLEKPDPKESQDDDDVTRKYKNEIVYEYSGNEVSFDQLNDWSEFITFNNPNRESWEKTSLMLNYLNIREGDTVADVGCGTGYFSFKFAEMVGKTGKVYATEINKDPLEYVEKISSKYGLNIETIQTKMNDACLPADSIDTIYMCSMYHAVYIASIEYVKDEFIASLKKGLKKGGRLIIVDNSIAPRSALAYFGSGIAKELTIAQLKYYGFHLVDSQSFIPQRYILVFQSD